MIIDDVVIKLKAGDGGKGMAVFSRTKGLKGPTGGNGGNGGSIFFEGISDLTALRQFRFRKDIKADRGEHGKSSLNDGHNAEDLTLFVPVGTVCKNLTTQKEIEITKVGQRELVAKGGRGGRGNFLFRSSTNTSPTQFEEGKDGQFFEFQLQLKMIADVGVIRFPNVGKSSLLNELTASKSKVANYTFTTLEPNLGAYYDLLLEKPEYIFLSKSDIVAKEKIAEIVDDFKKQNKEIIPISIIDLASLEKIKKLLNQIAKEKQTPLFI